MVSVVVGFMDGCMVSSWLFHDWCMVDFMISLWLVLWLILRIYGSFMIGLMVNVMVGLWLGLWLVLWLILWFYGLTVLWLVDVGIIIGINEQNFWLM